MLKRLICLSLLLILASAGSVPFPATDAQARDLALHLRTNPEQYVLEDSFFHVFVTTNQDSWVTIAFAINDQFILWNEHVETTAGLERHFQIPVVYPLEENFDLVVSAISMDSGSEQKERNRFIFQKKQPGTLTLEGRILQCNPYHKIGLEGASIEIIDGPSPGREMTEDEGYFTFHQLLPGHYILRSTHPCGRSAVEKDIFLDEDTSFQEWCIQVYRVPDMDLWLNKPSGSVFEVGETVTVFMRSSVSMKADLMVIDARESKPLLRGIQLNEDEIQRFFWRPTLSQRLGRIDLSLVPVDENLCGEARYQMHLISNIQTGVIQGRVRLGGRPMPGVRVYLPLHTLEHAWTDERGYFEIPDVPPGIHVVRVMTSDEMYSDKHGVEVSKGQITDLVEINLPSEAIEFELHPPRIYASTHERREKRIPLTISLKEGIMENISIEILEGHPSLSITPNTIPSLLHEKRRVWLNIPQDCPIGSYPLRIRLGNEIHSVEWEGHIQVTGLSRGTFDGVIHPLKKTAVQGQSLDFAFKAEKFTNFSGRIALEIINLPPYTRFEAEEPKQAPASIGFNINTSMSTPPGRYTLWIKASGDGITSWYSCQIEVLRSGGTLASIPENEWNPIVSAGQRLRSNITLWSPKGETRQVRAQLAFGPSWLRFDQQNIGTVGEKPIEIPITINPTAHVLAGAYPYAINLIFGERGEGFYKIEGEIHVLKYETRSPVNLRARHIREEGTIMLTWGTPTEGADDIVGYNVYRSLRYPSLQYAAPLNYSLITERNFVDDNFLMGRSYWYTVKAVRSDASLSPASNTAEIRVQPRVHFSSQVALEKGEQAVCFMGEKIALSARVSHQAIAEVWIHQGHWSALVKTKRLIASKPQSIKFQTPDLTGEATIEAIFTHKDGQRQVSQHAINILRNKKGELHWRPQIISSTNKMPLPHAQWWVWRGPTRAKGYTDDQGYLRASNLSEGMYQLMIETGGSRVLTDSIHIGSTSSKPDRIELPLAMSQSMHAWILPDDKKEKYQKEDSVSLAVYASEDHLLTLGFEKDGIRRSILSSLSVEADQVINEFLIIPSDIPEGKVYLFVYSENAGDMIRIPLLIEEDSTMTRGRVQDAFENYLEGVAVNSREHAEIVYTTNEWGYYSLDEWEDKMLLTKKGFEEKEVQFLPHELAMHVLPYKEVDLPRQEAPISISSDYTQFEWQFEIRSGWIPSSTVAIFSGNTEPVDEDEEDPEEKPWRIWESRKLFPDHSYRLEIDGLPLTDNSQLTWESRREILSIPITRGLPHRWYLDIFPEIPILQPGEEGQVDLDVYSFGAYREEIALSLVSTYEDFSAWLLPDRYVPGQFVRFVYDLPKDLDPGVYTFCLIFHLEDRKDARYFSLFVEDAVSVEPHEHHWAPQLYRGTKREHTFYFTQGIEQSEITPSLPEGAKVRYFESSVYIELEPFEALSPFTLTVKKEGQSLAQIIVDPVVLERTSWRPPQIELRSEREGVVMELGVSPSPMFFKVFRSYRYEEWTPLDEHWNTQREYIDKTARERETYRYSILATNGKLEAGWSNIAEIAYRKLFIVLNHSDGFVTRSNTIEWRGSVSIGARLFINDQHITLGRNGVFSERYTLREGSNSFTFKVVDEAGNTLVEERTVYKDTQPPSIERVSPDQETFHTLDHTVTISVRTEIDAHLSVNGSLVETDGNGLATYEATLNMGKNEFRWVATDRAGNQSNLLITIYRYVAQRLIQLQIGHRTAHIDRQPVQLDSPPLIVDGRTLVPLRFIAEAMGSKVDWIASTKEIVLTLGDRTIQLQVGVSEAIINRTDRVSLDVPPLIVDGRTLVPLRFIAEVLNGEVTWFPDTKEIQVTIWVWE